MYDVEDFNISFAKAKEIDNMTYEQVQEYLTALKQLITDVQGEIEYVETFGVKEED